MLELEAFKDASENFRSALTRYLDVCSNLRTCVFQDYTATRSSELVDQIRNEFNAFPEYETQLRKAKTAIIVTCNNAPSIAPINTLPSEILINIFHWALTLRPCTIDHIAQVCSHWRSIALGECALWSQIRYDPPKLYREHGNNAAYLLQPKLFDQAKLHLCRSGHSPLQLYLTMGNSSDYEWYDGPTESLFKCTNGRIQSLRLSFLGHNSHKYSQGRVLGDLLLKCEKDTFTQFVASSSKSGFIAGSNSSNKSLIRLDLTSKQLDDAFSSVKILRLHNMFLDWKSTAYHNLIDLCLFGSQKIQKSVLISILKMSPHLRTFHFGISLDLWDISDTDSYSHIQLVDLELLRVVGSTVSNSFHAEIECLLSLIYPGKKELRLFLEHKTSSCLDATSLNSIKHTQAFIQRSNIVEIHAEDHPLASELMSWPVSNHLVLYRSNIQNTTALPEDVPTDDVSHPKIPSKTLYLSNCTIILDDLRSRLQRSPFSRLVLYKNRFKMGSGGVSKKKAVEAVEAVKELSAICSTVILAQDMPTCVSQWLFGVANDKFDAFVD